MPRSTGPLARLRPIAGPLLLALFIAAAQVVPALHLATHRDDHTHGAEVAAVDDGDAPSAAHDGDHDDTGADPRAAAFAGHGRPARPASSAPADHAPRHHHDGLRSDALDNGHGHSHGGADHDDRRTAARPAAIGDRDHHATAPPSGRDHGVPASEHGRGNSAHFGLALIDGPPPLFLPAPPETLAPAPDVHPRAYRPAPLPQPPARGPPASA